MNNDDRSYLEARRLLEAERVYRYVGANPAPMPDDEAARCLQETRLKQQ
jgi:hypothetical protein